MNSPKRYGRPGRGRPGTRQSSPEGQYGKGKPTERGPKPSAAGANKGKGSPRPERGMVPRSMAEAQQAHAARTSRPSRPPRPAEGAEGSGQRSQGWDSVAGWYDKLVGESGMDYHQHVILPAAVRLLQAQRGERVLDLCCGQGVFAKYVLDAGAEFVGVDASPKLIESARGRIRHERAKFLISNAAEPAQWADGSFHAAVCIMAVHDVENLEQLFQNLADALLPNARAVIIFMHPCFRIPRQTHWGWDEQQKIQYRRMDRYGSPLAIPIQTHPGKESALNTQFYHRPLAGYLNELGAAGLAVMGCEELYSHRRSQEGPRSRAEHRAAEEFPLFMALVVQKVG